MSPLHKLIFVILDQNLFDQYWGTLVVYQVPTGAETEIKNFAQCEPTLRWPKHHKTLYRTYYVFNWKLEIPIGTLVGALNFELQIN